MNVLKSKNHDTTYDARFEAFQLVFLRVVFRLNRSECELSTNIEHVHCLTSKCPAMNVQVSPRAICAAVTDIQSVAL